MTTKTPVPTYRYLVRVWPRYGHGVLLEDQYDNYDDARKRLAQSVQHHNFSHGRIEFIEDFGVGSPITSTLITLRMDHLNEH